MPSRSSPVPPGARRARLVRVLLGVAAIAAIALLWRSPLAPDARARFHAEFPLKPFALLLAATYVGAWLVHLACSRKRARVVLRRGLVCTAAIAALVGLFEIVTLVGGFDWRRVLPTVATTGSMRLKPWRNPWNQVEPKLLYVRRPGCRLVGTTTGDCVGFLGIAHARRYPYDLQYDGHGFRNPQTLERAPIAFLGDSFVEGVLSAENELASARVGRALGIDVANLGLAGYGPQQELAALERFALPLEPRFVFWFFFEGNDLTDAQRYPSLEREWSAAMERVHGFADRCFTTSLLDVLARLCAPALRVDTPQARRHSGKLRALGRDTGTTIYFPYPAGPLSRDDRESLSVVEEILLQARRLCEARRATLVCVFVPDKLRVYRPVVDLPPDADAALGVPNELPALLEAHCEQHDIGWLDLTGPLEERARAGELVYFPDDGHWNAEGYATVAERVVAWIRDQLKSGLH